MDSQELLSEVLLGIHQGLNKGNGAELQFIYGDGNADGAIADAESIMKIEPENRDAITLRATEAALDAPSRVLAIHCDVSQPAQVTGATE